MAHPLYEVVVVFIYVSLDDKLSPIVVPFIHVQVIVKKIILLIEIVSMNVETGVCQRIRFALSRLQHSISKLVGFYWRV